MAGGAGSVLRFESSSEEGVPCIDVAADSIDGLLDNRDPAPFRNRDLEPSLVEYLVDSANDLL